MPAFLTARLAGPIASGMAVILLAALLFIWIDRAATIGELRGQIATLTKQRDDARADLVQCSQSRVELEGALQRQTAAVVAAHLDSQRRIAALDRAADDARRGASSAETRARSILNRPGTGDACADADALIMEVAGDR